MTSLHAWYNARCICMCCVVIVLNFGTKFLLRRGECKIREIPISGKRANRNFGYKIVISVKNPKFILWISDNETDFTVGIVS